MSLLYSKTDRSSKQLPGNQHMLLKTIGVKALKVSHADTVSLTTLPGSVVKDTVSSLDSISVSHRAMVSNHSFCFGNLLLFPIILHLQKITQRLHFPISKSYHDWGAFKELINAARCVPVERVKLGSRFFCGIQLLSRAVMEVIMAEK